MALRTMVLAAYAVALLAIVQVNADEETCAADDHSCKSQQSLLCAAKSPCHPTRQMFNSDATDVTLSDTGTLNLQDAIFTRAKDQIAAGKQPMIVQVGPYKLSDGEMEYYKALLEQAPWNLVFVEPQAEVAAHLKTQTEQIGIAADKAKVIAKAICPNDGVAAMPLHYFNMDAVKGLGKPVSKDLEGEFDMTPTLLKEWLMNWRLHRPSLAPVLEGASDATLDSLIKEVSVPCTTPRQIEKEFGYSGKDWDLLLVDAEGYDAKVVTQFLELENFAPAAIMFEWTGHKTDAGSQVDTIMEAVKAMANMGYDVHKSLNDIIAIYKD